MQYCDKKLHVDEDNRCLCKTRDRKIKHIYTKLHKTVNNNYHYNLSNNSSCTSHDLFNDEYKGLNHRVTYCYYCLCRDVETNPGPNGLENVLINKVSFSGNPTKQMHVILNSLYWVKWKDQCEILLFSKRRN